MTVAEQGYKAEVDFSGSPTLSRFMESEARVRIIQGPVGSGKSVACCAEIMRLAMSQEPVRMGFGIPKRG